MTHSIERQAAIVNAAKGCCPRCGKGPLFDGPLKLRTQCQVCHLDFSQFNVGDGPAAFAILIVGTIISVLALWTDFQFHPPWWAHFLLWFPLLILLTVISLRLLKGALLGSEYINQAREGRLDNPSDKVDHL